MRINSDVFFRTHLSRVIVGAFLFALFFIESTSAAIINTSASCILPVQGQSTSISNSSSCTIGSLGVGGLGAGYSNATASVSYSLVGNNFNSTVSASAYAIPPSLISGSSSATSDASLSVELYTTGPVRQGFLEIFVGGTFAGVTGGDGIGSKEYSLSPTGIAAGCVGALCFNDPLLQPITLGSTFQFNEDMKFTEMGNNTSGQASGFGTTQLTFLFFEANGVTPAQVSEAPEPGSRSLLSLGFLAVVVAGRRMSQR